MNLIPLEKELSCLQLYADLEQFRMNMEVEYRAEIDPDLSASQVKIPPFILQPFVENALWHGLSRKEGGKNISLRIYPEDHFIICEITDNGIGRKKAGESYQNFPEGHLAKALTITRQRIIDFNRSAFPEPIVFIDLEKDGSPAGTRVILRLREQD
jgi:two-component system LytT family sensor kinase